MLFVERSWQQNLHSLQIFQSAKAVRPNPQALRDNECPSSGVCRILPSFRFPDALESIHALKKQRKLIHFTDGDASLRYQNSASIQNDFPKIQCAPTESSAGENKSRMAPRNRRNSPREVTRYFFSKTIIAKQFRQRIWTICKCFVDWLKLAPLKMFCRRHDF